MLHTLHYTRYFIFLEMEVLRSGGSFCVGLGGREDIWMLDVIDCLG